MQFSRTLQVLQQEDGLHASWENGGEVEQDLHRFSSKITEGENIGKFQCNLCGKISSKRRDSVRHVENIHFPGSYQYQCDHCDEKFDTNDKWRKHRSRVHSNKMSK